MFSTLFETVFPALGRFFGFLAGMAQSSFMNVIAYALPADGEIITIDCINVFTGQSFIRTSTNWSSFFSPLGFVLGKVNEVLRGCIYYLSKFLGITDLPFWIGLLVLLCSCFVAICCVKFIKHLFPI